jgi:hypothetical protein
MSLLFFEHQGNHLLRAKGVVILDMGHHLTSHPTDLKVMIKTGKNIHIESTCMYIYTLTDSQYKGAYAVFFKKK